MLRKLAAVASLSLLSSCAIGLEHIDVAYRPMTVAQSVPGASGNPVELAVSTPTSPPTERVGVKKNGYGMEMGGLAPIRPVADVVRSAFSAELAERGFPLSRSDVKVSVEVTRFFSDYKPGFFTISSEADVTLAVTVRTAGDNLVYSRTVTGRGVESNALAATPAQARQALEKALPDAVTKIVSDPNFMTALFVARRPILRGSPSS